MAGTRVARFNIMITAAASQVGKVFSQLANQTKSFGGNLTNSLTTASFAFNQITQAVQPFVNAIAGAVSDLDELAGVSSRLEIDPNFLQSWRLAGKYVNATSDQMDKALTIMQRKLGEFKLGIGGTDLGIINVGRSELTGDLQKDLTRIIDGVRSLDSQTARAAAATKIFGKEAQQMLGIFDSDVIGQATKDIKSWGGEISGAQLEAVGKLDDAYLKLTESIKASRNALVAEAAPQITQTLDAARNTLGFWKRNLNEIDKEVQRFTVRALRGLVAGQSDAAGRFRDRMTTRLKELSGEIDRSKENVPFVLAKAAEEIPAALVPQRNPLTEWLNSRAMQFSIKAFAANFADTIEGALSRSSTKLAEMSETIIGGTGAVQAGTVEAAKFQFGRVQERQLDALKAIERNTRSGRGSLLQAGLQVVLAGIT